MYVLFFYSLFKFKFSIRSTRSRYESMILKNHLKIFWKIFWNQTQKGHASVSRNVSLFFQEREREREGRGYGEDSLSFDFCGVQCHPI